MRPIVQLLSSQVSGPGVRMWAQLSAGPTPFAAMAPGVTSDAGYVQGNVVAFLALVLLLVAVGVAVKLYDRSRKREDEAVALQARISNVLMVEPSLAGLLLTPTVRMPRWRREPVMIELSGWAPRPALRQAAINLVIREVESMGLSCCLQDRVVVNAESLRRAA
jgi:hypothetical protein